jgi:RNA ligase (TIGR02306 family)
MANSDALTPAPSPAPAHTRRLVTVRRIAAIERDKKHSLDFAHVDGWTVLLPPRHRFRAGDHVVYLEIDSFLLKSHSRWWELVARDKTLCNGREGHRVTSRRVVGGRVSQGLVFPLDEFPEVKRVWGMCVAEYGEDKGREAVLDMSFEDVLGVTKYVAEMDYAPYAGTRPPPGFICQPAWERAQNIPHLFRTRGNTTYQITEKLDGWSMSVYCVGRGSR